VPLEVEGRQVLGAGGGLEATLRRGEATCLLRLRLESEEIFQLPPARGEWTVTLDEILREQFGHCELAVEEAPAADPDAWSPVLALTLSVEADPAFRELHEALVAELEEVHLELARDIVSRTWHERGGSREVRALSPEDDLKKMTELCRRLEHALDWIGEQPSPALRRRRVLARWRPGDLVGSAAAGRLGAAGCVRRDRSGLRVEPRKLHLERSELSTDIEEHRHIRAGILRLADRAAGLARHCRRARHLLEEDEGRWSGEALEERIKARSAVLERTRAGAEGLETELRRLLERQPYLRPAGAPRTALGPTPLFAGRPAYREAFRALVEARRHLGGRYDAEGLRMRFRSLATLYEYWLFIKVVGLLRERLGAAAGDRGFSLIDEVYRPELAPGQEFRFRLPDGAEIVATYEPDFAPARWRAGGRYRAALVTAPLRPDVVIELRARGREPAMLALDAKSGRRFSAAAVQERLKEAAKYLWLIHDPRSGEQPVRQLFLVHRDLDAPPATNLSHYLEGGRAPPDARVLGAVPAAPGSAGALALVLSRFLETFRVDVPPA
jgi:hypothetical protein